LSRTAASDEDSKKKTTTDFSKVSLPAVYDEIINATDVTVVLEHVKTVRRMLSLADNPPVLQVIEAGFVDLLVGLLQDDGVDSNVQFEACWALTNIASTDETRRVVEAEGALEVLIHHLMSENADLREQCAWCLGNIAGDRTSFRDTILEKGALAPLLQNISFPENTALLRNVTWTLSNLCRGKPEPDFELLKDAVDVLGQLIKDCEDEETVIDALWALSYISDGEEDRIEAVMNANVVPQLINNLEHPKLQILTPSLRILGNMVSGSDEQTNIVLESGVMGKMASLLCHSRKNIRKEACWLISNVTAGSEEQSNYLMQFDDVLGNIIVQLREGEWEVQKEAMWTLYNLLTSSDHSYIQPLVELGTIEPICNILSVDDPKIITIALESLWSSLQHGDTQLVRDVIEECDGQDKIYDLQQHTVNRIYKKASNIIQTYFGGEEVEQSEWSENLEPSTNQTTNTFSFGGSSKKAFSFGSSKNSSSSSSSSSNHNTRQVWS
jgi:hypothetical protein